MTPNLFMNQFYIGLLFLISSILQSYSQSAINLVSYSQTSLKIEFNSQPYTYKEVETNLGTMNIPMMQGASPMMVLGAPDLQKYSCSYIIPDGDSPSISLVDFSFRDYILDIAPSKGNLLRNVIPSQVPYNFGSEYAKNEFFPSQIYDAQPSFSVRDFEGQALWIYPFQYNPISRVLRVFDYMEFNIEFQNPIRYPSSMDSQFQMIYENLFINYDAELGSAINNEDGGMLIIAHDEFVNSMEDFMNWKTRKGLFNEIVAVSSIGGQDQIKTYIQDYYNANNLTYVLLVGDHQQVPAYIDSTIAGYSDNYYGYIDGDDSYPEVFVGRFSAERNSDVLTQVNRVIQYEQNPSNSDAYEVGVGIGSNEGPGDDDEFDYDHLRNIRDELLDYTYSTGHELYDGSQGGEDAEGNPTSSDVQVLLEEGLGIINYTGHGSSSSFASSGYNSSDIDQLTNTQVHPFIWSVACVNGDFTDATCFAESWLRATHNSSPSGAIAALMSTIDQSWSPPMEGQDHMNLILAESSDISNSRSFGGISMNGCMQMNTTYGSSGDEMTDTWTCFGDPSIIVRTKSPELIDVSYDSVISIEDSSFDVLSSSEGALVTLTSDGEIIGSANVVDGIAIVDINPLLSSDSVFTIVVTNFNAIPHQGTVLVVNDQDDFNQVIELSSGWNLFSTYIQTEDMDLTAMLSSIDSQIIVVKDNSGLAYIQEYGFNGIGLMQIGQGYLVKLRNDTTLILDGSYMLPEDNPHTLHEGWNMFGSLRLEPTNTVNLFEDIIDELIIIKNINGLAYLPQWNFNAIENIKPGFAYQVKINSTQVLFYLPNSESY